MRLLSLLSLTVLFLCVPAGCNPGVKVTRNPGPHDTGIRYYRPKPYLLVSPAAEETTKATTPPTIERRMTDKMVSISLDYLPDFSEEYSIKVRPGLGTADVEITLDDGWNLTAINQNLDSNFDDNVKAVAELVKAAGGAAVKGVDGNQSNEMVVCATNVPIGYYESVIGRGLGCEKRLYGWRYVGFAPFNSCPTEMMGTECVGCEDFHGAIYGLVFEKGVMRFKQLNQAVEPDLRFVQPTGCKESDGTSAQSDTAENISEVGGDAYISNPSLLPLRATTEAQ